MCVTLELIHKETHAVGTYHKQPIKKNEGSVNLAATKSHSGKYCLLPDHTISARKEFLKLRFK